MEIFSPFDNADQTYGNLLREAEASGVSILALLVSLRPGNTNSKQIALDFIFERIIPVDTSFSL